MAKVIIDKRRINELLTRSVDEILIRKHLKEELLSGRRLKVKLGIDPTSPDLHLGHSVVLKKLGEFQNLGHETILVIGDFTARIGDPSGRTKERKRLTDAEIEKNMKNYRKQAGKILDPDKLVTRYNSEWLGSLGIPGLFNLFSKATYTQLLKRRDFKKKLMSGENLSVLEMIYPLLQGYDSYMLKADVELGGTDQKLNLLMGRQIQKRFGQKEQDILMTKLLVGLDGKIKMSKSERNYIGLWESPKEMYVKVMSLPDRLVLDYFKLCTNISMKEISELPRLVSSKIISPLQLKKRLARETVTMYHSKSAAESSEREFERVVQEKGIPSKISNIKVQSLRLEIIDLLLETKMVKSRSEAKRLIKQGGVAVNEEKITDQKRIIVVEEGMIIRAGKRQFIRLAREDREGP